VARVNALNMSLEPISQQIDELHGDIQHYLALEKSGYEIEFWTVRSLPRAAADKQLTSTELDGRVQRPH
jgi:hypothetical protein